MTAKVRSRVTDGLTLKIDKNVKIGEIDHNGAYLCESKHIRILILHHLILKSVLNRHKAQLKKCEKQWRLFCFVFAELNNFVNLGLVKNCHSGDNCNEIGRRFTAFVFKQMTTEMTIGQTTIGQTMIGQTTTEMTAKPEFRGSSLVTTTNAFI